MKSTTLYNMPLGYFPNSNVMPDTVDGVMVLARAALDVGETGILDKLELHIIGLLKIEPECGTEKNENAECESLFHEPTGIVLKWRITSKDKCPACRGSGELTAFGKDGCDYDVECPRCFGGGVADDAAERYVITDIDGHFLREAA